MDDLSPPTKNNKGFFDIVPAGKKTPDSSSRPLLVTNQPEQKDPMVATPLVPTPPLPEPATEQPPPETTPATPPANQPKAETEPKKSEAPEPAKPQSDVVVSRHKMAGRTLHNVVEIFLILIVLVVIADLLLDLNVLKFALPHTHLFGG